MIFDNVVKKFYEHLPFNKTQYQYIEAQIKKSDTPWPELTSAIQESKTVLEMGSGQGWLSNRIARNFPQVSVTGIDFVQENINTSKNHQRHNSQFFMENIIQTKKSADTVVSIGVLHHIPNNNIEDLIALAINSSNKYTFIGLYHDQSRKAMFDFFNRYPENKRYKLFTKMTPWITDEQQRTSWYRDQFDNPYETTISLQQFKQIAKQTQTDLIWSSVNTDNTYDSTMQRLESYEFTSGFIYGLYKK